MFPFISRSLQSRYLTANPNFRFCQQQQPNDHIKKTASYQHEQLIEDNLKKISQDYFKGDEKIFSNYCIYENTFNMDIFKSRVSSGKFYALFWSCVCGASYYYINPLVAIIPGFITFTAIGSFIQATRYTGKLIKKLTIEEDMERCIIETANGTTFKANIQDNMLTDIVDVIKSIKGAETITEEYRKRNYVIVMDTIEEQSNKENNGLRILLSPDQIKIENINLFKLIIEGESIKDWTYQAIIHQDKLKEDEMVHKDLNLDALEKQLEEEQALSKKE